eukprot:4350830-Pyramimonas_sp.AAC.1
MSSTQKSIETRSVRQAGKVSNEHRRPGPDTGRPSSFSWNNMRLEEKVATKNAISVREAAQM